MTEAEWLAAKEPQAMLKLLQGKASNRKLRLFALACCRNIPDLDSSGQSGIDAAERYIEETGSERARLTALKRAQTKFRQAERAAEEAGTDEINSQLAMAAVLSLLVDDAFAAAVDAARNVAAIFGSSVWNDEPLRQADAVRCIFGLTPFRPATVAPSWQSATCTNLALAIYDDRAFDRLPILADALEDAGCDNADVLSHCRSKGSTCGAPGSWTWCSERNRRSMTEAEWLACEDPRLMLENLRGKVSDRKLRLFAVACCRRIWSRLSNESSRRAVEPAERFVEGTVTEAELRAVSQGAAQAGLGFGNQYGATNAAYFAAFPGVIHADRCALYAGLAAGDPGEPAAQTRVLRCIVGPVGFRPIVLNPSCRTSTVVQLAERIYDERAFERLPILADALEDAGCDKPDVLNHCRAGGEHVRGCWVVDLVLGKQ